MLGPSNTDDHRKDDTETILKEGILLVIGDALGHVEVIINKQSAGTCRLASPCLTRSSEYFGCISRII